jgi:hypothetical protein
MRPLSVTSSRGHAKYLSNSAQTRWFVWARSRRKSITDAATSPAPLAPRSRYCL